MSFLIGNRRIHHRGNTTFCYSSNVRLNIISKISILADFSSERNQCLQIIIKTPRLARCILRPTRPQPIHASTALTLIILLKKILLLNNYLLIKVNTVIIELVLPINNRILKVTHTQQYLSECHFDV